MRIGMTCDWRDDIPPPHPDAVLSDYIEYKASPEREAAFDLLLQKEIQEKIVITFDHSRVRLYNPTFPVPKPNGKWRKVLNNKVLCALQKDIHFKMESPEDIISTAQLNDFATSLDLSNAFNHLIVHPSLRPYLAFAFKGRTYTYRAMPFGAKHAPRLFTKALSYAISFIRRHWDIRMIVYMDDILLLHQDPKHLHISTLQIAIYLESLGWTVNRDKSEVTPKQQITFLGWLFDFTSLTLRMTPTMRTSLLNMLSEWIPKAYAGSLERNRSFASLIGSLSFLRAQLPRAGLYLQALHANLTQGVKRDGWNGSVSLNRRITSELLWWSRNIIWNTPFDFAFRPSQATLTTDAAEAGWGALLLLGNQFYTTSGFFLPSDSFPTSNQRETAAVLKALTHFLPTLEAEKIRALTIQSDNMTTVCNLARQAAGASLLRMTRAIFSILTKADIRIRAKHIPGIENTLTDSLSRLDYAGDYELKQEVFLLAIHSLKVTPTVDCFATRWNHKLPRFFAPDHDQSAQGAERIDGLQQSWASEDLPYLHPPISLIPRVLQKMRSEPTNALLVTPYWPNHSWWNSLTPLIRDFRMLGPAKDILVRGPTSNPKLTSLPHGNLAMFLISSRQ